MEGPKYENPEVGSGKSNDNITDAVTKNFDTSDLRSDNNLKELESNLEDPNLSIEDISKTPAFQDLIKNGKTVEILMAMRENMPKVCEFVNKKFARIGLNINQENTIILDSSSSINTEDLVYVNMNKKGFMGKQDSIPATIDQYVGNEYGLITDGHSGAQGKSISGGFVQICKGFAISFESIYGSYDHIQPRV